MIVKSAKIDDNEIMNAQGLINKIKENFTEISKVVSELDKDKARHFFDHAAQVGCHEALKVRKETEKRIRFVQIEAKKHQKKILAEGEKLSGLALSKIGGLRSQINEVVATERAKWSGKRRSR